MVRESAPAAWVCSHGFAGLFTRWRSSRLVEGDAGDSEHWDSHLEVAVGGVAMADDRVAIKANRNRGVEADVVGGCEGFANAMAFQKKITSFVGPWAPNVLI